MSACGVRLMRQVALNEWSGTTGVRAYAVTADENSQYQQAVAAYETHLADEPGDVEATINLAMLYWEVSRCRAAAGMNGRGAAARRLCEILNSSGQRFASSAEMYFWRQYITLSQRGEPLEASECRQLMQERPHYLEPSFVLFSSSGGQEAEAEAMRLLADCAEHPTARGRHVISVISGVLRWQGWHWA
jgi:hypothetical protein